MPGSASPLRIADGLELEVLHPPLPEAAGAAFDGNDASLVLRLTARDDNDAHGARRGLALLPGDAGDPTIRALLASGADLSAEVLVLPHHGGRRKLLPRLLDAVRPAVALASAGYRNRWGFPVADTRAVSRGGHPRRAGAAGHPPAGDGGIGPGAGPVGRGHDERHGQGQRHGGGNHMVRPRHRHHSP